MFRRKGQAAMEFLMTYGWAILVVLAAIGALAYFGVLSPDKLVPEKTTFSAPFPSSESAAITATDGIVQVALSNNLGKTVVIDESVYDGTGPCDTPTGFELYLVEGADPSGDMNVSNGESFILQWTCGDLTANERFESDLSFGYTTPSGLAKTHSGSVSGIPK
ncbi:hypothetical protein C0585_07850 [Candidatus Woesearchaeota archaeon]|nr:MAG: hypothetical protein C0585_07850 [Candidatus Woesearchaeota archaeon]